MADYKILTIPFGRDAVPAMVNDIPSDPIVAKPQRASFKQGFPSITTIPLVAGGIPPEGQDFNGILRDITEHIVHQNKGGMYKFAPKVVAAGGYPLGSVLAANDGLSLWVSLQDNNVQDFNGPTKNQWARIAFSGLDTLLDTKADKAVSINAGTGLTGGGNLSANRTLSVSYGTTAGTAAQGNDSRLSDAREWSAETVPQAEAEAGTATTRRAWTAQRVRQAIVAWWNGVSSAWGRGFVASANAGAGRTALELGNAATRTALGTTGALYSRDSILGPVSQSAGVPTGAIIERGSNANGEYVRFADGTQMCTSVILVGPWAANTSANATWTYPARFIVPCVVCANGATAWPHVFNASAGDVGTSQSTVYYGGSIDGAGTVGLLAIGRWY